MKAKKYCVLGLVVVMMLFCLTGCLRVDVGVVIKEDGTATMTSKLMIEEDAYLALLALQSDNNVGESDGWLDEEGGTNEQEPMDDEVVTERTEPESEEDTLDLTKFKKEVIGGEVYYTLEETVEAASYEELAETLTTSGDADGADLFSAVNVKKDGNMYLFEAVTTVSEEAETESPFDAMNSVTLTLTVTMPGEIEETTGEQLNENTVRFVLDDFSEAHTFTVTSKTSQVDVGQIVACVICVVVLIGCGVFFVLSKKKATAKKA